MVTNKEQFIIVFDPGMCGLFLAGLLVKYFNPDYNPKISKKTGDCHDHGFGPWVPSGLLEHVGKVGPSNSWHSHFPENTPYTIDRPVTVVATTHVPDIKRIKESVPGAKIILIDFVEDDIKNILTFKICKAMTQLWTKELYDKFAGPDWPEYDKDNLLNDLSICNEMMYCFGFLNSLRKWYGMLDKKQCDYIVEFKTILGLNSVDLNQQIANIVNKPMNAQYQSYIDEYRVVNKNLYGI